MTIQEFDIWKPQPYGEVFIDETYRIKGRKPPETVYDIGANVGCFTAFVKALYPDANVVSLEANADNFVELCRTTRQFNGVTPILKALANGPVFWEVGANRGGHTYSSSTIGYPKDAMIHKGLIAESVEGITLRQLFDQYPPNGPYWVKIDIEGGEQCLFDDKESNDVIRGAEYFAAELHVFAVEHGKLDSRQEPTFENTHGHVMRAMKLWLDSFRVTHDVVVEMTCKHAGMVWATKR